jgi:release factor glutamine methyltransferase
MATVAQALERGTRSLRQAQIGDPAVDARLILQHCLDIDHAGLIRRSGEMVDARALREYDAAIQRRVCNEPVSRITGTRAFFGNRFEIGPAVLDPRPETELLVERALHDFGGAGAPRFCDVGAGSGAVGISLLKVMAQAQCVALDISAPALEVAERNAEAHCVSDRWHGICSDYFAGIKTRFDFIVANPPYIRSDVIPKLPREVREHDPLIALDGGEDGLEAYRSILAGARGHLKNRGRIYLEIGAGQEAGCLDIAAGCGWRHLATVSDLGTIPRVVILEIARVDAHFDNVKNGRRKCLEFDSEQASFTGVRGRHFESRP